jgi:hypothetical protein
MKLFQKLWFEAWTYTCVVFSNEWIATKSSEQEHVWFRTVSTTTRFNGIIFASKAVQYTCSSRTRIMTWSDSTVSTELKHFSCPILTLLPLQKVYQNVRLTSEIRDGTAALWLSNNVQDCRRVALTDARQGDAARKGLSTVTIGGKGRRFR